MHTTSNQEQGCQVNVSAGYGCNSDNNPISQSLQALVTMFAAPRSPERHTYQDTACPRCKRHDRQLGEHESTFTLSPQYFDMLARPVCKLLLSFPLKKPMAPRMLVINHKMRQTRSIQT